MDSDVVRTDNRTGWVTINLTIADDGRLKSNLGYYRPIPIAKYLKAVGEQKKRLAAAASLGDMLVKLAHECLKILDKFGRCAAGISQVHVEVPIDFRRIRGGHV